MESDRDDVDVAKDVMTRDDDGSFDCLPTIDIPPSDARPLCRSRSAQHTSASSPCSSASPLTSVATATPSRSSTSARALSDLRSDRELITLVCSSSKSADEVDTLDLSDVAKKTRKALKSLRALADFTNLVHLDVSNNAIGSVDGVEVFAHLQVLTMARNHLKRLGSPLLTLTSLRHLDLSGNSISHLPRAIVHLEQLETLNVAGNSLSVLKEVDPLSKLANLHACTFTANPMCKLPTYKDYVICKLPSLEKLDDAAITTAGRDKSRRRFSDELFCKDSRLREAGLAHEHEQSKLRDAQSALEAENLRLKGELQVKSKLLQNKSKEWSSATGQLLQLQQEIAMLHLDRRGPISPGRLSTGSSVSVASASPPRLSDSRMSSTSFGSSSCSSRCSESFGDAMRTSYSSYDDGFATAISDDELDFHLRQPLHSPPARHPSTLVNAAVSPLRSDLQRVQLPSSSSSPSVSVSEAAVTRTPLTLDVRAGREDMSSYSKRLIDSACSPLRRSPEKSAAVRHSEQATSPHAQPSPLSSPQQQQQSRHFHHSFESPGAPSPPPAGSPRPGRSKSFDAVRRAFADLSPERRPDVESSLTFGVATAQDADLTEDDDAMQHELSRSRSGRFPTFEDDVACPAYEETTSSAVHSSASWRHQHHRADLTSDAVYSHARPRASPQYHDRLASPSPSPSPRSRAQRLWQRQHAEFRDETFGRSSPSKSPLKVSTSLATRASPASPVDKTMLTRQIQALQSCKQSLVSEIAKEEQLLHALKHEASSYVSQMDQLQLEIQVALTQDSAAAAAAAATGVTAAMSPRGASSSTQRKLREEESYRAKLECCRSKLRFAEDKEREIEMTMVRTTKRVLQSDLQHAPFDKEIFALTHKLQQVIVQKEEIHQEMSRLMVLMREQQTDASADDDGHAGAGPRRRSGSTNRSMLSPYGSHQQQTVDAMLEEEEQRQRLSEELQHAVVLTRKRLDELQRRYQDVVERVRVKEDLIASFVDELKDVERELALISQHTLAQGSSSNSPHPRRQRSVSLDFHPYSPATPAPAAPSPSQTTMDAVELELAEALQAIKDGHIDVSGTVSTTATTAHHNSSSACDGSNHQSTNNSATNQQQLGAESSGRQDASGSANPPPSTSVSSSAATHDAKAPVSTPSAPVQAEGSRPPSHEILLKELLTAEMLEEIKKDIYERLSKQLAAVAASATSASREVSRERSESLDHRDLHDTIAAALESQMKLALESFHKKRDEDSNERKKKQQALNERQRSAPSSPTKRPLRAARHDHSQQQQQPGGDLPQDDDISCDHLDDFKPVDASYAVKYRFVKHHFSTMSPSFGAPPSPSGTSAPSKSSRTTGAQRILKACERLEQAEHESRIDPISAIEVDPMGTKRSSLKVLLMGARDLPTTHLRTKNLDPYVSVDIVYPEHMTPRSTNTGNSSALHHHLQGGASFRSRTVKKSVYPVWDEEFEFAPVHSLKGVLHVRILNDRKLSREQLVGEVRIPLRSLLSQKKTVEWFPLRFAVPSGTTLSSGSSEKDSMGGGMSSRKTNTVLRSSGGSIRLQLQLSYSRVEKYKRAVDELVTKFFHEHNQLPPFIEAVGDRRSTASQQQQNQEQHESDDYNSSSSAFSARSSDNRRFGNREDAEALDELQQYHHHHHHQQYQQQQEQHYSGVPEVESPGKDNESTIPTFDAWRAEREADAAMQQQLQQQQWYVHHQHHTRSNMRRSEGGGRDASPQRTAADITIAAHAYDSSATHAMASPQLSAERSRQLWETPVVRESPSSGMPHGRSSHVYGHFTNDQMATYPAATAHTPPSLYQQQQHYVASHERAAMYHTGGGDGGGSYPTSTLSPFGHSSSRPRLTISTSAAARTSHSAGAGGAATPQSQAARAPGTLHRRPSKHSISAGGAGHAQSLHSSGRRRATTAGTHYAHHPSQRSQRPECFDDYSPYHPDFQFTDVLDLYGGSNGNSHSDLFAARTSKRKSGALHTWQATSRRGSSSGGVHMGLGDVNRKTDLRIFKSPGFARRQPSAGFPERYIGLDNQTCERLKRMFGRMDSGGSSSSTTVG